MSTWTARWLSARRPRPSDLETLCGAACFLIKSKRSKAVPMPNRSACPVQAVANLCVLMACTARPLWWHALSSSAPTRPMEHAMYSGLHWHMLRQLWHNSKGCSDSFHKHQSRSCWPDMSLRWCSMCSTDRRAPPVAQGKGRGGDAGRRGLGGAAARGADRPHQLRADPGVCGPLPRHLHPAGVPRGGTCAQALCSLPKVARLSHGRGAALASFWVALRVCHVA